MDGLRDGAWDIVMGLGKLRGSRGLGRLSTRLLLCLLLLLENRAKRVGSGGGGGWGRLFELRLGLCLGGGRLLGSRSSSRRSLLSFSPNKASVSM